MHSYVHIHADTHMHPPTHIPMHVSILGREFIIYIYESILGTQVGKTVPIFCIWENLQY